MSAPAPSSGGSNAVGAAIGAAVLILFLFNSPAPDTTKFAVIVGIIVFFVVSKKAAPAAN